ncbi:MAG: hypothetical protein IJS07_05525 [Bacteroidales bacterium]|nr:hypothetical protein [Bacteroidales bacterium]
MKISLKLKHSILAILALALTMVMAAACMPDDDGDSGSKDVPEGTVHTFPKE